MKPEWTNCPLHDCGLVAFIERLTDSPAAFWGHSLVRTQCIRGHFRIMPAQSLEIFEVLE